MGQSIIVFDKQFNKTVENGMQNVSFTGEPSAKLKRISKKLS